MHAPLPITGTRRWWDVLQAILDGTAVMASLVTVQWLAKNGIDEAILVTGLMAVVVFFVAGQVSGLHRRQDSGSADVEMTDVVTTWGLTLLVLASLAIATRYGESFSRSVILAWIFLAPSCVGFGRMALRLVQRGLLRNGVGIRRVAIAGLNQLGRQTAASIAEDASLGFRVAGFYDDRSSRRTHGMKHRQPRIEPQAPQGWEVPESEIAIDETERSGSLEDLVRAARDGKVDIILVTLPMRAEGRIRYLLDQLSDSTVSVYIVPDFFVFELLHSRWTSVGGLPAVSVFESPLFGVDGMLKRAADVALAAAALIVTAVPMLAIALAVKLSSPGPVFFRQRRYGLDGREILVWKFRSMRICEDGGVIRQATQGDPRVTAVGAVLRRTSLDELPQLLNVLGGSMSLVGPRPHATAHNEQYRRLIRGYMLRHKVKPGITGLAQVNGCRGETETVDKMKRRVEWDHRYIRGWSLWLDLRILARTLVIVWKQPQAY